MTSARLYERYIRADVLAVHIDTLVNEYVGMLQMVRLRGIMDFESPMFTLPTAWIDTSELASLIFPEEDSRAKDRI